MSDPGWARPRAYDPPSTTANTPGIAPSRSTSDDTSSRWPAESCSKAPPPNCRRLLSERGASECSGGGGRSRSLPSRVVSDPQQPYPAAFLASSSSLSTVFQLRAVLATPIPLSNFSPSFDVPNPFGVCR